ncbi:hypothetical protein MHK_011000 [Candidatus Magnetomorum sp. HK-1]|nr:hypothetical protein MHK_011000 [Candidatus Magnetomorum sp. HK-1]
MNNQRWSLSIVGIGMLCLCVFSVFIIPDMLIRQSSSLEKKTTC